VIVTTIGINIGSQLLSKPRPPLESSSTALLLSLALNQNLTRQLRRRQYRSKTRLTTLRTQRMNLKEPLRIETRESLINVRLVVAETTTEEVTGRRTIRTIDVIERKAMKGKVNTKILESPSDTMILIRWKIKINMPQMRLSKGNQTLKISPKRRVKVRSQGRTERKATAVATKMERNDTTTTTRKLIKSPAILRRKAALAIKRRTKTKVRVLLSSTELLPRKIPILLRQLR